MQRTHVPVHRRGGEERGARESIKQNSLDAHEIATSTHLEGRLASASQSRLGRQTRVGTQRRALVGVDVIETGDLVVGRQRLPLTRALLGHRGDIMQFIAMSRGD